jgi:hypothetical protein
LVYILAGHLDEINNGACAYSIVKKPMYNIPERLSGILEILGEKPDIENYGIRVHSKCLACGKEDESITVESWFG